MLLIIFESPSYISTTTYIVTFRRGPYDIEHYNQPDSEHWFNTECYSVETMSVLFSDIDL
jgi:hypothetical protein